MPSSESSTTYRSPAHIVAEWQQVEALYERGHEDPPPAVLAGRLEQLRVEHAIALRTRMGQAETVKTVETRG